MTNQQILDGSWTYLKGHIQEAWGQITDNDLQKVKGDVQQIVGLIQERTGEAREQIEAKLSAMKARASAQAREACGSVQHGYAQAEAAVQQRPVESVAIAFGSGLIAGIIVGLMLRPR